MARVCHVSSVHDSHDIRIFVKECRTLADAGYEVIFVAYGEEEFTEDVLIAGLGTRPLNRVQRIISGAKRAYEKAASLQADVYHLHDPELLPYAKKLKDQGALVVFDSHEDISAQIMGKSWIPCWARKIVARLYKHYETRVVRDIDAVVCATPYIGEQFKERTKKVVVVNNFPRLDDVSFQSRPFDERPSVVCYVGGISEGRGEKAMIKAADLIHGELFIAGERQGPEIACGDNCVYLGFLDRDGVNNVYGESVAGLVLLLPQKNYLASRPIKMFEYMAAGLPVVVSDFPEWRQIIEQNNCGICVDPEDSVAVGNAINQFLDNRKLAEAMGKRGRAAVEKRYNWDIERVALVGLYEDLL